MPCAGHTRATSLTMAPRRRACATASTRLRLISIRRLNRNRTPEQQRELAFGSELGKLTSELGCGGSWCLLALGEFYLVRVDASIVKVIDGYLIAAFCFSSP